MKKVITVLLMLMLCREIIICQTPVITMTTAREMGSIISLSFNVSSPNTQIQVDFGDGNLISNVIGTEYTTIKGALVGSQFVKIFGTGIILFDCRSNFLTTLDISKCTTLESLGCAFNLLDSLDVTNNTALTYLETLYNPLKALDVSKNTELENLECYINELTSLDVSKNVRLKKLLCCNNQLTVLDIGKNALLKVLNCSYNQLLSLDVSKNSVLTELYCGSNLIETLDVAKNKSLVTLSCFDLSINHLDLSNNKGLTKLDCYSNRQLYTLDITKNTLLKRFYCNGSQFASLDVSKNTALTEFYCSYNQLKFSTLPLKQSVWIPYIYSPQKSISIAKTYSTGVEIDLSSEFTVYGNATLYTWKTRSGTPLIEGTDYTIYYGKTVFLKDQTDSVYCEMTNATFPELTGSYALKTTKTLITMGTGTKDIALSKLKIYTYNKTLFMDLPCSAKLSIFDINGKLVLCRSVLKGANSLQLLKVGTYLIDIVGSGVRETKMVIIE